MFELNFRAFPRQYQILLNIEELQIQGGLKIGDNLFSTGNVFLASFSSNRKTIREATGCKRLEYNRHRSFMWH